MYHYKEEKAMKIKPFAVEEWMNAWEVGAKYNIAETCVDSISMNELFELTGEDKTEFLNRLCARRLSYGDIEGLPEFRKGVCGLYKTLNIENIVPTHGASGANHHVFYSLISPGDRVVSIMPTYQQLYSIPESYGADVQILHLSKENNYLPDLEKLRRLVTPKTKMICINNPNNPTGALMSEKMLREIVEIARSADAWILCDEVYRHLSQEDGWCPSIVDLYEKGISVSSMSKVFSLAGLRLGWIATHDMSVVKSCLSHRDYNLVSCGVFDEMLAAAALKHRDKLLERSRKIVRENLQILDDWVGSEPHVSYVKPKAGTTALVYYDLDISSYEFCEEMYKKTGAFVTPGDCFEVPHSMRIGYAYGKQDLIDGLKAISEYIAMKTR
jgi:aspartate/methionine/tyrosine aminotransferase